MMCFAECIFYKWWSSCREVGQRVRMLCYKYHVIG